MRVAAGAVRALVCAALASVLAVGLVARARADSAPPTPAKSAGPAASAKGSAAALLALAEEAMTTLDYRRSRELSQEALATGGLDVDDLLRAYRLIAVCSAQLDEPELAEQAFLRLFALEPGSNVAMRLAPARRSAVLDARGFWATHKDGFRMDVTYARRERQVVVRVRDPIDWARSVHVWWRFGDRRYVKAQQPSGPELVFDVPDIEPIDALEVYAFVADEHGNQILRFGRERDPHLFGLSEEELAEIMRRDIRGGQVGSYARRLEELGVEVGVHGYLSLELKPNEDDKPSFDLHHATAYLRASYHEAVSVELAMEWEHLGRAAGDFYLPHAFVDIKFHQLLIVRGGFFEVPVGAFNEYLYPDFLRITGLPPLMSRSIVPGLWSEVGLQLRGRLSLGKAARLTYAAFVSNGLEQNDASPKDGVVEEGGDIREMRFNVTDQGGFDKAVGGRIGLEAGDFDIGASGYTGRYTIEAKRRLNIADADFSYRGRWLTVRTEGAIALQETSARTLRKYGLYALVATRPIAYLEPYAQYDFVDLGQRLQRVLGGLAVYPYPNHRASRNLRLKSEIGADLPEVGDPKLVWFFQLTTGF